MSNRRKTQYNHSDLYGKINAEIDITEGNPVNDPRVVQYKREIKKLKEKIELQTELNRQIEKEKNDIYSQLDSYKKRCNDLQKTLDDKDQHLNEVLASITATHSKPIQVKKKKEGRSWFGFGSPRTTTKQLPTPSGLSSTPQPNTNLFHTPPYNTPISNSPSMDMNEDYIGSPLPNIDNNINNINNTNNNNNNINNTPLPCMTAPIGSLPPNTRPRRHGSVDIIGINKASDDGMGQWGTMTGTSSLIGMERNEMEFKIKNSRSDKLRNYVRDLFDKYYILDKEKSQLFQDLVKATHNQGWTEKQALNLDKEAKTAKEKEKNAKNHIRSLEKSLTKERKKIDKYKAAFEDFKCTTIKKKKELLLNEKKLADIISMKDEFIQRACYKLILYKDRLSQFEIPVFQEYVILISPTIQELQRYDGEGLNGPGASVGGGNLSALHEDMVHKQTPGGPGFSNDDVNSGGGTVTSIASASADDNKKGGGSIGRRKSSSRKSSAASQSAMDGNGGPNDEEYIAANNCCDIPMVVDGDINDIESKEYQPQRKNRKKRRKKDKKKRIKSHESYDDAKEREEKEDEINITITAKSKRKPKTKRRRSSMSSSGGSGVNPPSISNLSKKIDKEKKLAAKKKKKEEKERKKAIERKERNKQKIEEEDMDDLDLDDMVSSSSESSSEDSYLLLSDSEHDGNLNTDTIYEYALDSNGRYIENDGVVYGISNNLSNYVEIKLVKYPGTGELYIVITKFDDKKDAMEVFRSDFAKCLNIEKNQIEQDFTIYFENISLIFRCDDYEKARTILITLRQFFEQHCTNIQPPMPPPPEQTVTDQMNIFFGGF